MSSLILRNAVRMLVPIAIVLALFLFFKGHQSPGGGFVAGLVFAIAMVVLRMAQGERVGHGKTFASCPALIASGLALALATGLFATAMGLPMLTSGNGYADIPGHGEVHWATAALFDLGVMLTVAGVVMGMIEALIEEVGDEDEEAHP